MKCLSQLAVLLILSSCNGHLSDGKYNDAYVPGEETDFPFQNSDDQDGYRYIRPGRGKPFGYDVDKDESYIENPPVPPYNSKKGYPPGIIVDRRPDSRYQSDRGEDHLHEKGYRPLNNGLSLKEFLELKALVKAAEHLPGEEAITEEGYRLNEAMNQGPKLSVDPMHSDTIVRKGSDVPNDPWTTATDEDVAVRLLELADDVVDEYMEEQEIEERGMRKTSGKDSAGQALHSFNAPSAKSKKIEEQSARSLAMLETLALMTNADKDLLREIGKVDVSDRAAPDPTCEAEADCTDEDNLHFVDGVEYRTITGACNNKLHFQWGMAEVEHKRLLPNEYENGRWNPRANSETSTRGNKVPLPSARNISNVVHDSPENKPDNTHDLAIALFYFMQFIDHDLAKTPEGHVNPSRLDCCGNNPKSFCMPIKVEVPEEHYPVGYCMDARRSLTVRSCEDSKVRNQINELTAYLDASMVYGSSEEEMNSLRTLHAGFMIESTNRFLPESERRVELPCNVTENEPCFEAGDTRANVHPGLTTYHTLFVREHNRIVAELNRRHSDWSDERLFQEGRKIVSAMIQHIVYHDLLPLLFDEALLIEYGVATPYTYSDTIDASMTQAFSMAFRYHHLMPSELHFGRIDSDGRITDYKNVRQEEVFLKPPFIVEHAYHGIDDIALGMVHASCPFLNGKLNNAARHLLFQNSTGFGFDLAALNIMRGREWGMPSFAKYRKLCGIGETDTWEDLRSTMDDGVIDRLRQVYLVPQDIDLWTGVIVERPVGNSISGATQTCLLAKHFANIKHGDRFWYETPDKSVGFSNDQLAQIKRTTLARIMCSNLNVSRMKQDVFRKSSPLVSCERIMEEADMNLDRW